MPVQTRRAAPVNDAMLMQKAESEENLRRIKPRTIVTETGKQ